MKNFHSTNKMPVADKASLVKVEAEYRAAIEKLEVQQSENQKIYELINLESTRIDYINKGIEDLEVRKKQLHDESLAIKEKVEVMTVPLQIT